MVGRGGKILAPWDYNGAEPLLVSPGAIITIPSKGILCGGSSIAGNLLKRFGEVFVEIAGVIVVNGYEICKGLVRIGRDGIRDLRAKG